MTVPALFPDPPGRPDVLDVFPADPVHDNSDAAWAWAPQPDYVVWCGYPRWFVSRAGGGVFQVPDPCESWDCRARCAKRRAAEHLVFAAGLFERAGRVWVAEMVWDPNMAKRLATRARRATGHASKVGRLRVRRRTGPTYLFASASLAGREPPTDGEWLPAVAAYLLLREGALALPGPRTVSYSGPWRSGAPKRRMKKPGPGALDLGTVPEELVEEAFEFAADEIESEFGERPTMKYLPGKVSPDDWWARLKGHIEVLQRTGSLRVVEGEQMTTLRDVNVRPLTKTEGLYGRTLTSAGRTVWTNVDAPEPLPVRESPNYQGRRSVVTFADSSAHAVTTFADSCPGARPLPDPSPPPGGGAAAPGSRDGRRP